MDFDSLKRVPWKCYCPLKVHMCTEEMTERETKLERLMPGEWEIDIIYTYLLRLHFLPLALLNGHLKSQVITSAQSFFLPITHTHTMISANWGTVLQNNSPQLKNTYHWYSDFDSLIPWYRKLTNSCIILISQELVLRPLLVKLHVLGMTINKCNYILYYIMSYVINEVEQLFILIVLVFRFFVFILLQYICCLCFLFWLTLTLA